MSNLNEDQLIKQSNTAYNQWCEQWRDHAKQHSKFKMKSLTDFENIGIGKIIVVAANGYSLEENMDTLKKHNNVDILACDKSLGHLLDNGISPKYCVVCDANVDYEKYMEKYKDQLQDTILFINVCANPKWSKNGNWKDIYFFVNRDVINSHEEFSKLSGCKNFIPAGTNVSNAMIIFLTQCDNEARRNHFGYDKMLLLGFDYSWRHDGNYYAYDYDGGGKRNYMKHAYFNTDSGKHAYSSGNLIFSKDWILKYLNTFNLPVVQCAKDSLLKPRYNGNLEYQLQYMHKVEDSNEIIKLKSEFDSIKHKLKIIQHRMNTISKDHWESFQKSV
jgi:hypothetical protein